MFIIKRKREYALNKLFNFSVVMGLFLVLISVQLLIEKEIAASVWVGIVSIGALIPAVFSPACYAFDEEGVSLCYLFLPVERYLWKDISAIEVMDISGGGDVSVLEFVYAYVFSIEGDNVGACRFYMQGHIRKSFRTKRLLEKYWDGTITGYLLEDIKKAINKRKAKKQTQIKAHLTDEVVPMERQLRVETRQWIAPFAAKAKQYDLEIKMEYLYITEDCEELRSRPNSGYTYTMILKIARFQETDENRIVEISVDLLKVRLGRTAYRGVKNERAREEFQEGMSVVLDEIIQNGIETYCSDN